MHPRLPLPLPLPSPTPTSTPPCTTRTRPPPHSSASASRPAPPTTLPILFPKRIHIRVPIFNFFFFARRSNRLRILDPLPSCVSRSRMRPPPAAAAFRWRLRPPLARDHALEELAHVALGAAEVEEDAELRVPGPRTGTCFCVRVGEADVDAQGAPNASALTKRAMRRIGWCLCPCPPPRAGVLLRVRAAELGCARTTYAVMGWGEADVEGAER
ncbi:hypothetical protein K438DRAFT_1985552 [Mycena galopus ATCC 62051]|nr:hypothetical protein K438DRAFT_1985552 [Mycena galopus ATCC 62051]